MKIRDKVGYMENKFRMIVMCDGENGSIVPCEDVSLFETLEDAKEWAEAIIQSGNAHYINIYQNDEMVCRVL
jgi:hypothetical protein